MFLYRGPEEIINDIIEEGKENYNVWLGIMVSEDHIIKFEIDNNLILLEIEETPFTGYFPEFNELGEVIASVLKLDSNHVICSEKKFIALLNANKNLLEDMN